MAPLPLKTQELNVKGGSNIHVPSSQFRLLVTLFQDFLGREYLEWFSIPLFWGRSRAVQLAQGWHYLQEVQRGMQPPNLCCQILKPLSYPARILAVNHRSTTLQITGLNNPTNNWLKKLDMCFCCLTERVLFERRLLFRFMMWTFKAAIRLSLQNLNITGN